MKLAGIIIISLGMFLLLLSLAMNVSIGEVANNMLLARQSNFVLITSVMTFIGFILYAIGVIEEKLDTLIEVMQEDEEIEEEA